MTTAQMQSQAMQMSKVSPEEISNAFFAMVDQVAAMKTTEIDSLSEEEVLKLGKPILDATAGTKTHPQATLEKVSMVLQKLADNPTKVKSAEHKRLSKEASRLLETDRSRAVRQFSSPQLRDILKKMSGDSKTLSTTCEDLFDQWGGYVHLYPGDNLRIANNLCDAGTIFYVHSGTHRRQYVTTSKDGNFWLGVGHGTGGLPVLDGEGMTSSAFSGGMKNNKIAYLEIEDYTGNGIYSTSSNSTNIEIYNMSFYDIAPNSPLTISEPENDLYSGGESNGAINLYNCQNIKVRDSNFHNVSSGVLFTDCDGPLQVINNEALNPGRNFFQCNRCNGGGIKVNGNSMEHTYGYGNTRLEDFINISDSKGNDGDPIQVNHNRARTNGSRNDVSKWGSFIILGDSNGEHQQAVGNIGVTPGQVGIGVAGGKHMLVANNGMFGEAWDHANVAFYSIAFYGENNCTDHTFTGNTANWVDSNGTKKNRYTDENCDVNNSEMEVGVSEDPSMDETIWNLW